MPWPGSVLSWACISWGYSTSSFPCRTRFKTPKKGVLGAFLLGLLFGVVSTPCATPILSVLLVYIASKGSYAYGAVLLFSYALGHCILIIIAAASMGMAKTLLESRNLQRAGDIVRKGGRGSYYAHRILFS